jgi:hypothetical protein
MSRRVIVVLFGTVLVGAVWAVRPIINSQTVPVSALRGRKRQLIPQPRSLVH